jgi:hypothetical protein
VLVLMFAGACGAGSSDARTSVPRVASRDTPIDGATASAASTAVLASSSALVAVAQQGDTTRRQSAMPHPPVLDEAEQRVADGIVFAPRTATRFLVAGRNKRLLLDIGRVDLEVKKDPNLIALIRRVSARTGPLARVTRMTVRGSWGDETDSIVGYDVWNGRAVAVLAVSPRTDSLLRRNAPLVGVATIATADSTAQPVAASNAVACVRDSIPTVLLTRVSVVRDSLVRWMTDSLKSPFARLVKATAVRGDATIGCFATWRAVVIVTSRTPSLEWNEERALLIAADGSVMPVRLRDLRLRAHESLMAFDADGDGIDELSARGLATRMGAQSVLKLDPTSRRFSRYASGFAWESQ